MSQRNFLLLDIGNSRMKWNVWQRDAKHFARDTQIVDYKSQAIKQVLDSEWGEIRNVIHAVLVANVAGESVAQQVTAWCVEHWGIDPRFITTGATFHSVKNGYRDHRQLGVDRWLAVIAAQQLCPDQDVIVIDCGTATTVDTLDRNGQHYAGPIMPGCHLMQGALLANTAKLDITSGDHESMSAYVENTQNAIVSGANFAASSALNTIVSQIRRRLADEFGDSEAKVIVTGGAAQQLMPLTQINHFRSEPDLVLIGLRRLADEK